MSDVIELTGNEEIVREVDDKFNLWRYKAVDNTAPEDERLLFEIVIPMEACKKEQDGIHDFFRDMGQDESCIPADTDSPVVGTYKDAWLHAMLQMCIRIQLMRPIQ